MKDFFLFGGLFLRFFVGIILLSTGISKLQHPLRFQQAIRAYKVFAPSLDNRFQLSLLTAFLLFPLELFAGACLILGTLLIPAISISIFLFLIFSFVLLVNIGRGRRDLSCHCAGVLGDQKVSWWHILRNGCLLLGMLFLLLSALQAPQPDLIIAQLWGSRMVVNTILPLFLLATLAIIVMILSQHIRSHWQFLFD